MTDTHMSRAAIESVRLGQAASQPWSSEWMVRSCGGAKLLVPWCEYDLALVRLAWAGAPMRPPVPGELPTCSGCLVRLDAALEVAP